MKSKLSKSEGLVTKISWVFLLAALTVSLSSCATVARPPVSPPPIAAQKAPYVMARNNTVHTVAPGETLWRLSKMYDVPMQDVSRANNLGKTSQLKEGQRVIIPNAAPIRPVVSLYPGRKWRYIIVHHSATDGGDSLEFNKLHKRKGWDGIGYDFVIGNGTRGKVDGAIEVSPRWLKQEDGAHCRASDMNCKGIGICLVGNFSKENISAKQMDSLVYLANVLRKYYKIPLDHILGHGQVKGARTECPGKYFPWQEFRNKLKNHNYKTGNRLVAGGQN